MPETRPWDAADHLTSPEDVAAYLSEALQDGDPGYFQHALGVVARSEGMSALAVSTGLNRENLYRTLSDDSNPRFQTIVRILDGLGLVLDVKPAPRSAQASSRTHAAYL
ncbi:putative addiction module antidote protein [Eggerthella sp. NSJ-70]|uniref:Addiction module antidote protein n=1 Tax=Eggerthella hominis TaxID=2763043 RepID=A0ABR7BQ02_9ACTN|nr:addiction module antidote protein [Eggerthella hominis]MBC5583700.1 putative addiction module antidote protein [Eggerthella hominis]